jgi:hypothetical protein
MSLARIVILGTVLMALIAGALLYYLQIYAYYTEVDAAVAGDLELTSIHTGAPEAIVIDNFRAIDSNSAPIRFRACFDTPLGLGLLTETYVTYPAASPLIAPGWFDCFDAPALGAALQSGEAVAFLGREHIVWGVDRVVAFTADGRGYAWHQINPCGQAVFNGEPAPEGCPPVPESTN